MPFGISSIAVLRDTFRRAVKQAMQKCEETHSSHYRSRCRFLGTRTWTEFSPTVQAIQATDTEFLLQGTWRYTIDARTKNHFPIAQAEIAEVASLLASMVPPGEAVKGTFDFPPSVTSPDGESVTCVFRGVVRGRLPLPVAA
jgi:hypothetical protein